jgi:hypothetical protein
MTAQRVLIGKRRTAGHLTDSEGAAVLRANLPIEWVLRPYQPDYGVDFDLELFGDDGEGGHLAMGEHLLVQLKSRSRLIRRRRTVSGRLNVEKHEFEENTADQETIAVFPIQIDTSDLALALSMGPAAPLLLIACDVTAQSAFFLCLSDYAEKIVLPQLGGLPKSQRTTVYIPEWNRVSRESSDVIALRFLAERAKLMGAFNKFNYQKNEISHVLPFCDHMEPERLASSDLLKMVLVFIDVLARYDFWGTTRGWPIIEFMWLKLEALRGRIKQVQGGVPLSVLYPRALGVMPVHEEERDEFARFLFLGEIEAIWHQLGNLGNVFEEVCREWFLPTLLGSMAENAAFRNPQVT